MNVLNPYLMFSGNCEDALKFYETALSGNIRAIMRFGESPDWKDEASKNNVMHSEFEFAGNKFMASDAMPSSPIKAGDNITMCIGLNDENQAITYFNRLSEGGNVQMPLQDTFWGAKFGQFVDKFGISWMINCEKPQ
jgi:PhnB protein